MGSPQDFLDFILHLRNAMPPRPRTLLRLTIADQTFSIGRPGKFHPICPDHIHIKQTSIRMTLLNLLSEILNFFRRSINTEPVIS